MSASARPMSASTSASNDPAFWERLWRSSGIQFVGLFIVASVIYGSQPRVGASADALVAFYNGDRTRILIAAFFSGLNLLNLLWFTAALRTTLADAGEDGWGAAATAASAAFAALFFFQIAVGAALAYSIAGSGNHMLTAGLNDFTWVLGVLILPARDADHGWCLRALAGQADLECDLRRGSRSRRARSPGGHHMAKRRILGGGRCVLAVRLAPTPAPLGGGRESGTPVPGSCYACRMVMPMVLAALLSMPLGTATAQASDTPAALKWLVPPLLPPGALLAVVSGDPTAPGVCTMELSMPDGYRLPPHYHPHYEHVEVKEGTILAGMGDRLDPKQTQSPDGR